jgi:uncharacterized YigZ family protein
MLFSDTYKMVASAAEAELVERGSRFIAYVLPVETEEQAKTELERLRKEHHKAAHHCSAWVIGRDSATQRSSDDREPAGSAGKPILRELLAHGLTNTMVVVVRYFGGKLLGIPGLINAYSGVTGQAIAIAGAVEKQIVEVHEITYPYGQEADIFRIVRQFNGRILGQHHTEEITLRLAVPKAQAISAISAFHSNYLVRTRFIEETDHS